MKKVFLITVTAIFVAMIVFLCLFLAGNRQSDELSAPINPYPNYKNIVFLNDWTNLYIDTLNDEYSSMIFDMREYKLSTSSNRFGNIDNSILYFSNWNIDTKSTRFFKYDIVTELISEIEYESNFTSQAHSDFYALGDYLYYSAFDDWYDLDERVEYLCRIPINGGKEEIIGEYANREEKYAWSSKIKSLQQITIVFMLMISETIKRPRYGTPRQPDTTAPLLFFIIMTESCIFCLSRKTRTLLNSMTRSLFKNGELQATPFSSRLI